MNYPIPPPMAAPGPMSAVDDNALVEALQIVIRSARSQGQTLSEVMAEVLADDPLLSASQRQILSEVVAKAWEQIPEERTELAIVTPISAESRRSSDELWSVVDCRLAG
jgi:hypothetical protein